MQMGSDSHDVSYQDQPLRSRQRKSNGCLSQPSVHISHCGIFFPLSSSTNLHLINTSLGAETGPFLPPPL